MLRIAALNDNSSSEDDPRKIQLTKTKEATEAEAFSAYNKALLFQQKGHSEHAEKLLQNLLTDSFLQEASALVEDEEHSSNHHGLQLLYSIHKNLASIMLERKDLREAMKYYIEAVRIDPSEVTVWYKMGQTACKLSKYQLAKQCFEQALQCNRYHWPSLDNAITMTFALGDYLKCLEHISTALEKDFGYLKGLVLRKQILREQPSLENLTRELFENCDHSIYTICVKEADLKEFMEEALQIRSKCRQLINDYKDDQSRPMAFIEPLIPFKWKHFGQQLINLYDFATSCNPPKSLALEIDLRDYYFLDPSVFLGQSNASEEIAAKNTVKEIGSEKNTTKVASCTPADKIETMNAFQKAKEQKGPSKLMTDTLTIGDEAKENALMKRLYGETVSYDPMKIGMVEGNKDDKDVSETKRQKLTTVEDQEDITFEDIATGNDFDIPLLGDVDMDLDINLSDIRKMELKPDLLLKAREEDLTLSDPKSLENVLSSVIEMECESKGKLSVNLKTTEIIDVSNEDINTMNINNEGSVNMGKYYGKGTYKDTSLSEKITVNDDVLVTTISCKSQAASIESKNKNKIQISDKIDIVTSKDIQKDISPRQRQKENQSIGKESDSTKLSSQMPQNVPKVTICQERIPLSSEIPPEVQGSWFPHSIDSVKQTPKSVPKTPSSPITSSLLSSSSGELSSSASFYHSMLNKSTKNWLVMNEHYPDSSSAVAKNDENMSRNVRDNQMPSQKQCENLKSEQTKNICLETKTTKDFSQSGKVSDKFKTHESSQHDLKQNCSTVSVTVASSTSPQKSTGEFIEDIVRNQLGLDSATTQVSSSHSTSFRDSRHGILSSSPNQKQVLQPTETSFTQKLQNLISPPATVSVSKISPTQCSVSARTQITAESFGSGHAIHSSLSRLTSLKKSLALLNIPEHYLNSLSTMEANTVLQAAVDREQILRELNREQLPSSLSALSGLSAVPACLESSHQSSLYPLISPLLAHAGGSSFFHGERSPTVSSVFSPSLLLSPPPRSQAPTVLPPYPLLSHQQDYSFAPYSASLMASLYPPMSPSSKYPLIPSTSPSYLQSRLLGHSLLDTNLQFPNSSIPYLSSPVSYAMTSPLPHNQSRKRHSPSKSSYQPDMYISPVKINQKPHALPHLSTHPEISGQSFSNSDSQGVNSQEKKTSFQAMIKSMLESSSSQPTTQSIIKSIKSPTGKDTISTTPSLTHTTGTSKRGPKRKINELSQNDWTNSYKRRSMRNRSGRNKKEERNVDYRMLLKKHFPPSLNESLEQENDEVFHDRKEMDTLKENGKCSDVDLSAVKCLTESEECDVKNVIKECFKSHGLKDIMYKFLLHLARKFHCIWPEDIADIYIQVYSRLRTHLSIPSLFEGLDKYQLDVVTKHSTIIVMLCELLLEKAHMFKDSRIISSPVDKPDEFEEKKHMRTLLGHFYEEDMEFLYLVSRCVSNMDSVLRELTLRFYWLKAKQQQIFGEILDAIDYFEIVLEIIKGDEDPKLLIILPNMSEDKIISAATVSNQLDSLRRCDRLENTRKLYDQGNYVTVVDNLLPVFEKQSKTQSQRERPSQLLLLQDSLCKLDRKEDCLRWTGFSIAECLIHIKRVTNIILKQTWSSALISSFTNFERLLNEDPKIFSSLDYKDVVKLAHNLVTVIEMNLDVGDSVMEMPINTLLPFKILFRILEYDEKRIKDKKSEEYEKEKEDQGEDVEFQNKPLQMLLDAHEYLGRHGWCTRDDGNLLLFIITQLQTQMAVLNEDDREELVVPLEQCILCLYNHPNKKGKSRHLCDHNAKQINLTWERSGSLVAYFTSGILPEFDSKRTSSISSDVEYLLRRIYNLVPEELNPASQLEAVASFIEGSSFVIPTSWEKSSQSLHIDPYKIQKLLYYLLADFYFKNNEFKKAIKFYQLDLVINASRVDSWAGLALAKKTQIEQELNAIDIKMDSPVPKKWDASIRCFQRAVELERRNRKLWMEYGFLAYQLHSHASRQAKLRNTFAISGELLAAAQRRRHSMLQSAYHSFKQAENCERDETSDDWLVHYMLGKIAEKQKNKPSIFLEHYMKASKCLHEEKAVYPKKIMFTNTPPHLALESLEVFYRIHASILKLLLEDSLTLEDMMSIDVFLTLAQQGKFATHEEKNKQPTEEERDNVLSQFSKNPSAKTSPQSSSQSKVKQVYHRNPVDHEYAYFRSNSDSQSSDNPGDVPWQEGSQLANLASINKDISQCSEIKHFVDGEKQSENSATAVMPSKERQICADNSSLNINLKTSKSNVNHEEIPEPPNSSVNVAGKITLQKDKDEALESLTLTNKNIDTGVQSNIENNGQKIVLSVSRRVQPVSDTYAASNGSEADVYTDALDVDDEDLNEYTFQSCSAKDVETQSPNLTHLPIVEEKNVNQTTNVPLSQHSKLDYSHGFNKSEELNTCESMSMKETVMEEQKLTDISSSTHSPTGAKHVAENQSMSKRVLHKQASEGFTPRSFSQYITVDEEPLLREKIYIGMKEVYSGLNQSETEFETRSQELILVDKNEDHVMKAVAERSLTPDHKTADVFVDKGINVSKFNDSKEITIESQFSDKEKWESEDQKKKCTHDQIDIEDSQLQSVSEIIHNKNNTADTEKVDKKKGNEPELLVQAVNVFSSSGDKLNVVRKETNLSQSQDTSDITCRGKGRESVVKELVEQNIMETKQTLTDESLISKNHKGNDIPASLKDEITQKCISGLQLCASRFSSHYKSLYCLAHFYWFSSNYKNLAFSRDLLLGRTDWLHRPHMPAPGLFAERKLNNFFQGLWKIPNDDVDRPGCFASHVFQSVQLLLRVLCDLDDCDMLKFVRDQLKRNPDSTKKYLRDAERQALVEEAYKRILEVLEKNMNASQSWSEEKREENLAYVYRLWLLGKGSKHGKEAKPLLLQAFRIMMKGRTDINRLTAEQAISYCKQNVSKNISQTPVSSQTGKEHPRIGQNVDRLKSNAKEPKQKSLETVSESDVDKPADNCQTLLSRDFNTQKALSSEMIVPDVNKDTNSSSIQRNVSFLQINETEQNESIIVISDAE